MVVVNDSGFPSGSAEYWYASPQIACIHPMYTNRVEIGYESRRLEAFYSPACGTSLSIVWFDILIPLSLEYRFQVFPRRTLLHLPQFSIFGLALPHPWHHFLAS